MWIESTLNAVLIAAYLWRLKANAKTLKQLIRNFSFTEDAAVITHIERALQCIASGFTEAAQLRGLKV